MKKKHNSENIPIGWTRAKIKDFAPLQRGYDLTVKNIEEGDYPVIFSNGPRKTHNVFKAKGPGVVTGRSGTIGKVYFIKKNYWPHNTSLWVTNFKDNTPKFVFYFYKYIKLGRFGSGSGVPTLNRNDVHAYKIVYPPPQEQNRIVAILETWDKAIELLSKKIKIKKNIKKGLSEQLLSGKKSTVKNKKEWENINLGSICKIKTGGKDVNEGNPRGNYPFFTCGKSYTYSDDYSFDCEAIIVAGNGDVGNCMFYSGKFEAYQRTYVLHSFCKNINYIFLYLSHFFQNFVSNQKQSGAMPYIKIGMLKEFTIYLPTSLQEQKAIAKILTTADDEITALEKKKKLLEDQKKFLLNNLVTGKIRTTENLLKT